MKSQQQQKYSKDALQVLKETSRTFFIPISKLQGDPKNAVASAYLCLRAIDEIEDHETIPNDIKAKLLRKVSMKIQQFRAGCSIQDLTPDWEEYESKLPEVSLRIGEWILYCPEVFQGRIVDATSAMADRMANWAEINFKITCVEDLDAYTFSVAGAVGLLLSDIWAHYDGCKTDRSLAIGFGRGLQTVNILRNKLDDKKRGVEWYPPNFTNKEMFEYSEKNLANAKLYMKSLPKGSSALLFCRIPLNLATATIQALKKGQEKLSRNDVEQICKQAEDDNNVENDSNNTSGDEKDKDQKQQQQNSDDQMFLVQNVLTYKEEEHKLKQEIMEQEQQKQNQQQ